jgi:hypothetical protein
VPSAVVGWASVHSPLRRLSQRSPFFGRSAAYEAARTGQLPTIKIGRRLLVPIVALDRLLEKAGRPAAPSPLTPAS